MVVGEQKKKIQKKKKFHLVVLVFAAAVVLFHSMENSISIFSILHCVSSKNNVDETDLVSST